MAVVTSFAEGIAHMRVAIYGRVSTVDRGQDIRNQLVELRRFAASQGWTIQQEYVDHMSGKHAERPAFRRMFQDAAKRKFDVCLFWALDRLSREGVLETLTHLNTLSGYGIGFHSYSEPYLDSCGMFKDAVVGILATIAKQERIRISERVRAGLQTARAKGRTLGRPKVTVDAGRVADLRAHGLSWSQIVSETGWSKGSCQRAVSSLPKNHIQTLATTA